MNSTIRTRIAGAALAVAAAVTGIAVTGVALAPAAAAASEPVFGSDEYFEQTQSNSTTDPAGQDCLWYGKIRTADFTYVDSKGRASTVTFGMATTYYDGKKIAKKDRKWQFMGFLPNTTYIFNKSWNQRPAKFSMPSDLRAEYPVKADLKTRVIK